MTGKSAGIRVRNNTSARYRTSVPYRANVSPQPWQVCGADTVRPCTSSNQRRKREHLMDTRGFLGFVADGHETITYVQFDSYPSGLGVNVLSYASSVSDWPEVRKAAAAIAHVSDEVPPTDTQIETLARWTNRRVGERTDRPSWYQLLRETQGCPAAILEAGYAEHLPNWPADSLFCEWGYLLDLDAEVLEVYAGFQRGAHSAGRFHDRTGESNGYRPVRLIASWSLHSLPTAEAFVSKVDPEEDE